MVDSAERALSYPGFVLKQRIHMKGYDVFSVRWQPLAEE